MDKILLSTTMNRRIIYFLLSLFLLLGGCATVPETTETDHSLPVINLAGYPFHAEAFGNPEHPVLIILHGGPGADYKYLRHLKALADKYFVVFYDQRGTGLSPRVVASDITLSVFIEDLNLFAHHFSPERPVILLGHSWGAMLATAYTSQYPHRVNSLVLAEPQFLDQSTIDSLPGGWPGIRVVWGVTKAWFAKWTVKTNGDPYARSDYFLSRLILLVQQPAELCNGKLPAMQMNRFGSPAFDATIGRVMAEPEFAKTLNFVEGIERFKGRALFLTGACNTLYGAHFQKQHLKLFNNAQLIDIADAGHFMFNDQPETTQRAVRVFLGLGSTGNLKEN